eukprot:Skav205840  [mRNA]  locus=scaffold160:427457:429629:+ [translate_table: standard]
MDAAPRTGLGAAWNTLNVEGGSSVAVFGLGAVGLSVIQGQVSSPMAVLVAGWSWHGDPKGSHGLGNCGPGGRHEVIIAMAGTRLQQGATPNENVAPCNLGSHRAGDWVAEKVIVGMTKWGVDYTFDCGPVEATQQGDQGRTGNVEVMRAALECAHRGWGESCVIGVAGAGKDSAAG